MTAAPGTSPAREPTPVRHHRRWTDHERPSPLPPTGQTIRSRLPTWTGRRAKDGTRKRAAPGQAAHRIPRRHNDGLVEAAEPCRINATGQPTPRRPAAGRDPPTPARWRRHERREAGGIQWMPPIWPARLCRSGSKTGGRICPQRMKRFDHRRRASLRRLMMSAFGPPPAPLRSVLSDGQPTSAGVRRIGERAADRGVDGS